LDAFLKDRYRKRSRAAMVRALATGAIRLRRDQSPHLTAGRLKPSTQLIAGDEVLVVSERRPEPPVDFNYRLIHEDDELFVVDKPANLPVHPAGRYFFNTLLTHLTADGKQNYYLAHRLDKETSGIMAMTKTKASCADLTAQFASRTTQKTYLAIVRGHTPPSFTVDAPMLRSNRSVIELKMMIAGPDAGGSDAAEGMPALTAFETVAHYRSRAAGQAPGAFGAGATPPGDFSSSEFSLVRCFPKTGRQHQIRLHLEHAGHPIVGDKLYGIPESESLRFYERQILSPEALARIVLPRHALHAHALEFEHPRTGRKLRFESPLPADLQAFLDGLERLVPEAQALTRSTPEVSSAWQPHLNTPRAPLSNPCTTPSAFLAPDSIPPL
jgi:23S rRNA pseudouridine1911/1915/1917 synthase